MAFVNFATREITAKLVFYGPGLGGKTTSLQHIHSTLPNENRGKMISLATEEDRTIYFDFLPLHLGKIQDFAVRVQLYTVPGQVRYNATRKLVLRGADGLVFVADSQKHKKLADAESFNNMEQNLREHGKDLKDMPHILQFNKIDLPGIMSSEELNQLLNKYNVPFFETCATNGIGVFDALKSITKLVFNDLSKKALLQRKRVATGSKDYVVERRYERTPESAAAKPAESAAASSFHGPTSPASGPRLTSFAGKTAPPPPAAPVDEYSALEMEDFEPETPAEEGHTPAA
ncbi:MAG TPA: GTPase domain-containing protein, partial [Acidobacteriota bacterium]|nr:GTPase domain-containing protein [Acidobacteriota bacterium]